MVQREDRCNIIGQEANTMLELWTKITNIRRTWLENVRGRKGNGSSFLD